MKLQARWKKSLPSQALRVLRVGEWWDKLLHLAGAAFILWSASDSGSVGGGAFSLYLAAAASLLTVGYTVNAAADFRQDTFSRQRSMGPLPPRRISIVAALAAAALAAFFILAATKLAWPRLFALATLVIGCGYSLPPWRFKERGIWGVLVGAVTQKPALFMVFAAMMNAWNWLCALLAFWLFCGGMLGMLGHQLLDGIADANAGVRTFVTAHGARRAMWLCLVVAAGVAVACALPLVLLPVGTALPTSALLSALSVVYAVKGWRVRRHWFSNPN